MDSNEVVPADALDSRVQDVARQLARSAPLALRGLLDAVHSQHEARWAALQDEGPLPGEFAGWLADFDLILNFWPFGPVDGR